MKLAVTAGPCGGAALGHGFAVLVRRVTRLMRRGAPGALALAVLASRLDAQADPTGRWRTLSTQHFDVHVRQSQRGLALRAAAEAEAAYAALAQVLRPPRGRIHLVVADHVDESNGFATVIPDPRITIWAVAPSGSPTLEGYDRWLRMLITHELAHVFHLDRSSGWWGAVQRVLGRVPGLFPQFYAPSWVIEGLAVYYESRLTGPGRLQSAHHHAVTTAAVAEGGGVPVDAAGSLSPRWPGGLRPYAFGGEFFDHVAARTGDTVLPRLVEQIARRPLPYLQLNGALRAAGGATFTGAWSAWQQELVRGTAAPGGHGTRELYAGLRELLPPRLSPDGSSLLLVVDNGRDDPHVARLELGTGRWRRIGGVSLASSVAWWDTSAALVSQLDFTGPYAVRSDLWLIGAGARRLTREARLRQADVGPGGVVVAVRLTGSDNELVEWSPSGVRVLAAAEPGVEWSWPRFAPDGSVIAAVRSVYGSSDIVLLSRDGALLRHITNDPVSDWMPAFTPSGDAVVWSRNVDGVPQIVGAGLGSDSGLFVLTSEPFGAWAPEPADTALYFLGYHHDGYRLESVPLRRRLLREPAVRERSVATDPPAAAIAGEEPYRAYRSLMPRFWLPTLFVETGVDGRTLGWAGVFSAGADVLGRHAWAAAAAAGTGAASGEWQVAFAYQGRGPGRLTLDFALEREADPVAVAASGGLVTYCCLTSETAEAGVSLVWRRWRSALVARTALDVERVRLGSNEVTARGLRLEATYSSALTPALGTTPVRGWRLAAWLRPVRRSDSSSTTEQVAVASAYVGGRGGRFARPALAVRAAAGRLTGSPDYSFSVGGPPTTEIALGPGLVLGDRSRAFPLRGLAPGTVRPRTVAVVSVERREPLWLVGRGKGLWPLTFDRLSGTVFADGMMAGDMCSGAAPLTPCRELIGALGGELVSDWGVGWDFPVRLRLGAARVFGRHRGVAAYVAFGSSF